MKRKNVPTKKRVSVGKLLRQYFRMYETGQQYSERRLLLRRMANQCKKSQRKMKDKQKVH